MMLREAMEAESDKCTAISAGESWTEERQTVWKLLQDKDGRSHHICAS